MSEKQCATVQDNINNTDQISEFLKTAFLVRGHLEKLFNRTQQWNHSLSNLSLDKPEQIGANELKKFAENIIQMIMWSEPGISDVRMIKWGMNRLGHLNGILLLKFTNCKPFRLHIKLQGSGNNKVEFWNSNI